MINFFGKIRQRLLTENEFSKYLLYAVGEIVLVVFGILIALSINNWNENQKNRSEEAKILKALKEEMVESKRRIDETIELQSLVVKRNVMLSDLLAGDIHLESVNLMPNIFNWGLLIFHRAEPVTGTYDGLIGAGKTVLIQNEELSRLLAEYSAEIKLGYEDHEYAMIIHRIILENTRAYNGPLIQVKYNDRKEEELKDAVEDLINDKSIVGLANKKQGIEKRRLVWQKSLSEQISKIIEIIDAEL